MAAASSSRGSISFTTEKIGSTMKGRKTLTAPSTRPDSVKSSRTGASTAPSPTSARFTTPSLRKRIVQANAFTTTPTDSGRTRAASSAAWSSPAARASANAAG